ncbi:MAG: hypothetical protein HC906_08025 [Bacteroidales bacterium]|nr:hypothetical protein [Bacteroidales bacterium]
MNLGTLKTDRYSAINDLEDEGKLDNDAGSDILTRLQADARYNLNSAFLAANTEDDDYTISSSPRKVEFNETKFLNFATYSTSQDRYVAITDGVYHFSSSVTFTDLGDDAQLVMYFLCKRRSYCNAHHLTYSRGPFWCYRGR